MPDADVSPHTSRTQRLYPILGLLLAATCTGIPANAPGIDEPNQHQLASVPIQVNIENMTRSLSVIVVEAEPRTLSHSTLTSIRLAIRNDYPSAVVAFELVLPSGGKGRLTSLVDYFLSIDHPLGLQPEETIYRSILIPATLPPVVRVSGALLADGDADGEERTISEMRSSREAQIFQVEKAITMLRSWLSRSDLNLNATANLLMMKSEIDQLDQEGSNRQGAMYDSGLQYVRTYLQIWIDGILSHASDESNMPDLEVIIRTRLAALQRATPTVLERQRVR
jgi:hypothetical protein